MFIGVGLVLSHGKGGSRDIHCLSDDVAEWNSPHTDYPAEEVPKRFVDWYYFGNLFQNWYHFCNLFRNWFYLSNFPFYLSEGAFSIDTLPCSRKLGKQRDESTY
jgi:hypothetical protein